MPDGRTMYTTTSGHLPLLKKLQSSRAKTAHHLPNLSHSLLSISKLCDDGCTATFNKNNCVIKQYGKTILQGPRDPLTTLWRINLPSTSHNTTSKGENLVFNLETLTSQSDIIHFLHAALFSPTKTHG